MWKTASVTIGIILLATPTMAAGSVRATGIGIASSHASASALGVGNNFGAQTLRNTNAFNPSNSVNVGGQRNSQTTTVGGTTVNNIDPSSSGNGNGRSGWGGNLAPWVSPPSAPPAQGSCATALTFGASGPGAGLAFSLPWNDHRCDVRANTILLVNVLHLRKAGVQNACQDLEMAQALGAAGQRCLVGPTVTKQ